MSNMSQPSVTGEPRLASVASWAVLVASFGLSASTWVALAVLAGFTGRLSVFGVTLRLAWLMPIAVDGYVVVALVLWMSPVPAVVAAFARKNTYGAAGIGVAAQSAYHLLFTLSTHNQLWRVVMAAIVGAIPPAVAALAVHMRALIRRESPHLTDPGTTNTNINSDNVVSIVDVPVPAPAGPLVPDTAPSTIEPVPPLVAAATPDPDPAPTVESARQVPTPAELAARITAPRTTNNPTASTSTTRRAGEAARRTRPTNPSTSAQQLAPSTTDTPVSESDAAQLSLPIVPPELVERARQIATAYRAEHGTPITPGQLAVQMRMTTEQARYALAAINADTGTSARPISTVNGNRPKAAR